MNEPKDARIYTANGVAWDATGLAIRERLRAAGLQPHHRLLDFGCGALRAGQWLIPWLHAGRYYGVEPAAWVLEAGKRELDPLALNAKRPTFGQEASFNVACFPNVRFEAILISSIWTHASHAQMSRMLATAWEASRPGTFILVDYRPGTYDYTGDDWVYPEAVCHSEACIRGLTSQWDYTALDQDSNQWCLLRRLA